MAQSESATNSNALSALPAGDAVVVPRAVAVAPPAAILPAAALENLASRVRGAGLFLTLLRRDGTIAWHDASAGLLFQRFVLPLLQYPDLLQQGLASYLPEVTAGLNFVRWDFVPGVFIAAFGYVEKRNLAGIFLLAGKRDASRDPARNDAFRQCEIKTEIHTDVAALCSRLGLDGAWLSQQADELPAYTWSALESQARLVLSMAQDQARLAAMRQELDSLSSQLSVTYEELSLIYQLSSGMRVTRGAGEFFKQACLDVMDVMDVAAMGVALCGERSNTWRQEPVLYGAMSLPPGQVHRLAEGLMEVLRRRNAPLLINDLSRDPVFGWMGQYGRQLIAVPLQRQDEVLGCMFGLDKTGGIFDSVDSKLLNSIANESAIFLENARLYEDVRDLMMGMLHSLTSAVDAKDAYTCGHSERVALLAQRLSRQIDLPAAAVDRIYMAGLLHDVGKIGVPEQVLQKAGRLTPEEFDAMKKHPQIGAHILADIKQVADIIPGVMHHHERYDGKGYPTCLTGQEIPLMGRIICLADCFDAMTSNRTYRRALPLEVALTEIRRCAGTQFDPSLAESFLQIPIDQLRQITRDHKQATRLQLKAA